jgi:hypothetical protein
MTDAEIFAGFAREQGLNAERVESARQKGVSMTTLVTLCSSGRSALEINTMLFPVTIDEETAADLAAKARGLAASGVVFGHSHRRAA